MRNLHDVHVIVDVCVLSLKKALGDKFDEKYKEWK